MGREKLGAGTFWAGVVVAAVALFGARVASSMRAPGRGEFAAYWTAARLVSEGAPVGPFYDDEAFRASLREKGIAQNDIWYPNPPTTAFAFLPLAALPYPLARAAWVGLSAGLLLATAAGLARISKLRGAFLAAFLLFALHGQPSRADLGHGQIYALATALLALAARELLAGRTGRFGGVLGVLAVVKLAGSHLWLLALPRRRRDGLVWGGLTAAGLLLLSVPFVGVAGWRAFLSVPARIAGDTSFSVTAFQSLGGLVRRLLVPDARWNPRPLLDAPVAASILLVVVQAALAGAVLLAVFRGRSEALAFSSAILATLLASPFTQDYTFVQATVPAAFVLSVLQERPARGPILAALAGMALIGAADGHKSAALQDGAFVFLAYPKVYGALLLLGVALRLSTDGPVRVEGAAVRP